jgi:lipopolysaccharide export system protein LptA
MRTLAAVSAAVLITLIAAAAQPAKRHRQEQAKEQRAITWGDVTIERFLKASGNFSESITISGPNTTVHSVDKNTGATNRLQSPQIKAFMSPPGEKKGTVARIEASGGVKFAGTRPMPKARGSKEPAGTQVINGSGSRGTYFKDEGKLVLSGPVDYYAEQPGKDGKEWVKGTANEATYDENKRVLKLVGHVKADVFNPSSMSEPAPISGDMVTIDLSEEAVKFDITNESDESGKVITHPKPREPKKKGP